MKRRVVPRWMETAARLTTHSKAAQQHRFLESRIVLAHANQRWHAHVQQVQQVGTAWRTHLCGECLDPCLLEAFRVHAVAAGSRAVQLQERRADLERVVATEEAELRRSMALEQVLDAMVHRCRLEAARTEQQRQFREVDEAWSARPDRADGGQA